MNVVSDYCDTVEIASTPGEVWEGRAKAENWVRDYAIFALCAAIYILPFMRFYLLGTDEGTLDYGAERIAQGQVFARDFFEVMGPGTLYQLALLFKLFGISFQSTRLCLFIVSMGIALLMYFLSRRICESHRTLPAIFLAATCFGAIWPGISHHVDSNFYALLAVACILLWYDRRSWILLLAAGAVAGVTTVFLQPKGFLLFVAFLTWLWFLKRRGTASSAALVIAASGYFSVVLIVMLYFCSKGSLRSLVYVNFIWPMQHYETVNTLRYASDLATLFQSHQAKGMRWTIPLAALVVIPMVYVAALPGLLPVLGARFRWNFSRPEVLLYWLCGSAMWLSEIHRRDVAHMAFGSPLLMILCVHFLTEHRGSIANIVLRVLSVSALSLGLFNLCCLLLAGHNVQTARGTVKLLGDDAALKFLKEHVSPGEEIFAYPYCPRYYFLTATTNPTPYSIMLYKYNTSSQFQEVVRILEQRKVKYVVWDKKIDQVKADVFPGAMRVSPGELIIEPYLWTHYETVQELDGASILKRKD
jgi:hypothetical protein